MLYYADFVMPEFSEDDFDLCDYFCNYIFAIISALETDCANEVPIQCDIKAQPVPLLQEAGNVIEIYLCRTYD